MEFFKLFKYSLDGIVNFSQAPLSIASISGLVFTFIAFFMILFVVVRRLIFGDPVAGWASTVCIILFIGGVQLLSAWGLWDNIWLKHIWKSRAARIISSAKPTTKTLSASAEREVSILKAKKHGSFHQKHSAWDRILLRMKPCWSSWRSFSGHIARLRIGNGRALAR